MKLKKTRKSKKQRGNTTYGHGARKKWKKSGHKGGIGMAGSGKRGDQKKTLIIKKYGSKYFGKRGMTSKKTAKKKNKVINVGDVERNFDSLMEKFGKARVLDLSDFKLLGEGELSKKIKLKVREASESAKEKIEKVGGEVKIIKLSQDKEREQKISPFAKSHKTDIDNLKQDKLSSSSSESEQSRSNESSSMDVNNKKNKKEGE